MNNRSYARAVAAQIYTHAKSLPKAERLEHRDIEVLGRPATLSVDRIAPGRVRATVCIRERFGHRGDFIDSWALPRDVHLEAHGIALEAIAARGKPTAESTCRVGFMVDGDEDHVEECTCSICEPKPENDR